MKKYRFEEKGSMMSWGRFLVGLVCGAMFWACSDSGSDGTDVVGGASGDSGIIAIKNQEVTGVAQKGPFVTGSSVVLKETSAAGDFKPTNRVFYATTRSDKGDFRIEGISLESQYVRLTVTGYYERETTGENSACQVSLNALSDISNRDEININVLTHLEYGRILRLIKKGKTFAEAKKQAHKELMKAFYYEDLIRESESLDITQSGDDDKALKKISGFVDYFAFSCEGELIHDYVIDHEVYCVDINEEHERYCKETQEFLDKMAETFASSGDLEDYHYFIYYWFREN